MAETTPAVPSEFIERMGHLSENDVARWVQLSVQKFGNSQGDHRDTMDPTARVKQDATREILESRWASRPMTVAEWQEGRRPPGLSKAERKQPPLPPEVPATSRAEVDERLSAADAAFAELGPILTQPEASRLRALIVRGQMSADEVVTEVRDFLRGQLPWLHSEGDAEPG